MRKFESYYKKGMYATKTPMATNRQLKPASDAEHEAAKSLPYQSLIGVLVWCSVQVKIETATAVSMLGTHAAKWSCEHFEEALRVLLWMHSHRDEGIVFRRDPAFDPRNCLIAYADADLAGDPETRDMRIKKLKELQRQNVIKVRYCRTAAMVADIFTKNVNSVTFAKLAEYVTGRQGNRVLLLV